MLMIPGGKPHSSASLAKRIVDTGVLGAGLSTTALPAAMAGPICYDRTTQADTFQTAIMRG